jgi:cytochrome oxidase Cu insertion factor (SCO1/SenC/PrrC family)
MTAARVRLVLLAVAGLAVGALTALALFPEARQRLLPAASNVKVWGQALIGGPFTLTDHTGRRVSDADFRGRYMLVFFGFTFCPDVCPSALQVMSAALDKLGPKADRFVPILVTVDPERDTPQQLALYVQSFHPRLVGLTGTQAEVDAVLKAYRVYGAVRKREDPKSSAGYTVDHPAQVYVMDPEGRYRAFLDFTKGADAAAVSLAKVL